MIDDALRYVKQQIYSSDKYIVEAVVRCVFKYLENNGYKVVKDD